MEIKHISSKEFVSIAKKHEYFFWNLIQKEYRSNELYSYFKTYPNIIYHPLKEIVDTFKIPYFESYIEDEHEFIAYLKPSFAQKVWKPKDKFHPVLIGFNRTTPVISTYEGICYCKEGMIEVIYKTNPKFFDGIEID
jgi:hypothetical protein